MTSQEQREETYAQAINLIPSEGPYTKARRVMLLADREMAALRNQVERQAETIRFFEQRFPCDGGCTDAPAEDCSRHGREPKDLWSWVNDQGRMLEKVRAAAEDWQQSKLLGGEFYADAILSIVKPAPCNCSPVSGPSFDCPEHGADATVEG